nr:iron chelate uptake ABC transporter family permease subunit [Actinomyces sp.]
MTARSLSRRASAPAAGARRGARIRAWPWPPRLLLGFLLVGALLATSLATGQYSILSQNDGWQLFLNVRGRRTIALVLAGAAMSACGLIMQLVTQNRFVEPTTTVLARMSMAVLSSFLGTMVFFLLLRRVSLRSSLLVPVMGIMLGAVVSAVSTFLALEANALQQLGVCFQRSFTSVYKGQYEVLWVVVVVLIAVLALAGRLTVAGLGEDLATSVGVSYRATVLAATALIAPFEVPVSVVLGIIGAGGFLLLIIRRTRAGS